MIYKPEHVTRFGERGHRTGRGIRRVAAADTEGFEPSGSPARWKWST